MKYTTEKEGSMLRIIAARDIPEIGVKKGDKGGLIVTASNLSQEGACWVFGSACVYGSARVYGDAQVYDTALIYDNARVYGSAQVYGSARVYGDALVCGSAQVSGNARVFDNAQVYGDVRISGNSWVSGNAWVYGNAHVYGDARVTKTPTVISGNVRHTITITETHIFIGCEGHTIDYWRKNIKRIGEKHGYSAQEIKKTIMHIKAAII